MISALAVVPAAAARPSQSTSETTRPCNICNESVATSGGVAKGPVWFRCHACHSTVQRMELAARANGPEAVAILSQKKRKRAEFATDVLKLRRQHVSHAYQRSDMGSYIERLRVEASITMRDQMLIWPKALWVKREMDKGLTKEAAESAWKQLLDKPDVHVITHQGRSLSARVARVVHRRRQWGAPSLGYPFWSPHAHSARVRI